MLLLSLSASLRANLMIDYKITINFMFIICFYHINRFSLIDIVNGLTFMIDIDFFWDDHINITNVIRKFNLKTRSYIISIVQA